MYIEQLKDLFTKCTDIEKQNEIAENIGKITEYINRVVQEGAMITRASVTMEQPDFIAYVEELNRNRNRLHDKACEAVSNINRQCEYSRVRPVFPDFELGKNPPEAQTLYDGPTHQKVAEIGRVLINEFYYEGSLDLEKLISDREVLITQTQPILDFSGLQEKADSYIEKFQKPDLLQNLKSNTETEFTKITFGDGDSLIAYTGNNEKKYINEKDEDGFIKTADMKFLTSSKDMDKALGSAENFFAGTTGYEVPIGIVNDIAALHKGFANITPVKSFEPETAMSFSEVLSMAKKDAAADKNGVHENEMLKTNEWDR